MYNITTTWTTKLHEIPEIIRQTHPNIVEAVISHWTFQPSIIWITLEDGSQERWIQKDNTFELL